VQRYNIEIVLPNIFAKIVPKKCQATSFSGRLTNCPLKWGRVFSVFYFITFLLLVVPSV
jgi:hypothetical protein